MTWFHICSQISLDGSMRSCFWGSFDPILVLNGFVYETCVYIYRYIIYLYLSVYVSSLYLSSKFPGKKIHNLYSRQRSFESSRGCENKVCPDLDISLFHEEFLTSHTLFSNTTRVNSSARTMCRERARRTPRPELWEQNDIILFLQPWEREQTCLFLQGMY